MFLFIIAVRKQLKFIAGQPIRLTALRLSERQKQTPAIYFFLKETPYDDILGCSQ